MRLEIVQNALKKKNTKMSSILLIEKCRTKEELIDTLMELIIHTESQDRIEWLEKIVEYILPDLLGEAKHEILRILKGKERSHMSDEWLDNGFNYKTDYYDLYGLKFFSEYYDQNMCLLMTSFYTDDNKEVLTIHHQNGAFLVNTNDKTNVFYSYREFVQYVESFMKEVAKKALSDNQYFVKFYAASAANPNISFTIS